MARPFDDHFFYIYMAPPIKEWWKGHRLLPLSASEMVLAVCVKFFRRKQLAFIFFRQGRPCHLDTFLVLFFHKKHDYSVDSH